jgi:hypothetical protein
MQTQLMFTLINTWPSSAPHQNFENLPGRRLRPDRVEQAVAEQSAKRFAREEQDKLDSQ